MSITIRPVAVPLTLTPEGGWRVGESRVSLDSVLFHFNSGASAEEIVSAFPTLKLGDVYAVIAYYMMDKSNVDEYLLSRRKHSEAMQANIKARPNSVGMREMLLARQVLASAKPNPSGARP